MPAIDPNNLLWILIAALAVQQAVELLDPYIGGVFKDEKDKKHKLMLAAFALGAAIAYVGEIRVLGTTGLSTSGTLDFKALTDIVLTALLLSGGSDTFNNVLKTIGAVKVATKEDAKDKKRKGDKSNQPAVNGKTPSSHNKNGGRRNRNRASARSKDSKQGSQR